MSRRPTPLEVAQEQFDRAAEQLQLSPAVCDLLRYPLREFYFSIPVRMDHGDFQIIRGVRVQHNDARGPGKGGIRFVPDGSVEAIKAQAMWMTWKTAVADIPLGGSQGGFLCDPRKLSLREQEGLCRGWVRQMARNVGPLIDVPYPDLMTNAQHMLWMLDEYEVIFGGKYPGFSTGKPVGLGGSRGRTEAMGFGVIITVREAMKEMGLDIRNSRASIQGFGNVARHAVQLYQQLGGQIISVSSWNHKDETSYTFRKKSGVVYDELFPITNHFGEIDKEKAQDLGYEMLPGDDWIKQDVELLIPAATGNQISHSTVESIHRNVKILAEAASGPTTPRAEACLNEKNIYIIPDLLASSGAVICSYYEQVQSNNNYYWHKNDVLGQLDVNMTAAYLNVHDFARDNELNMRDAAIMMAVDRVAKACQDRGWI
jgi:glutamate dehydrogenase